MDDPIAQFIEAFERAQQSEAFDPSRCALATTDANGRPTVRFVLVKRVDERGFVFFTNYESTKAEHLAEAPYAALAFHWHTIDTQVRVRGTVERLPEHDSDEYFRTRDRGSQLGAWASPQSSAVESREALEANFGELTERFEGQEIPRPPFWGGYLLNPDAVEFWYSRPDRLHDRFLFERIAPGQWKWTRLAP